MSAAALSITAASLACPLGLRSAAVLAALRAGVTRFTLLDEPAATVSRLSTLPETSTRSQRMQALLQHALIELGQKVQREAGYARELPVFLALPEPDPDAPYDERACLGVLHESLLALLHRQPLLRPESLVHRGRAGFFTALRRAGALVRSGQAETALVGAVDSQVDPQSLRALAARGLLLGPANCDGRIPSEAAGFLLVTHAQGPDTHRVLAQVLPPEEGAERASFDSVHTGAALNVAHGLTELFRRVLSQPAVPPRVDCIISAQPGEGFWGREVSYAYLRNVQRMPEPLRLEFVGAELGDTAAAAGLVALLRALASLRPPAWSIEPPSHSALVYGVSDTGATGACVLLPAPL